MVFSTVAARRRSGGAMPNRIAWKAGFATPLDSNAFAAGFATPHGKQVLQVSQHCMESRFCNTTGFAQHVQAFQHCKFFSCLLAECS